MTAVPSPFAYAPAPESVRPVLKATARFVYVTLAGRSEAPVMSLLRQFVAQRMVD